MTKDWYKFFLLAYTVAARGYKKFLPVLLYPFYINLTI